MTPHLQSVLHPAGPDAEIISHFAWAVFVGGAVIFAAMMLLLLRSLRRHERKARPVLWIAGGGVALPVVVLTGLLGWSTWRSADLVQQTSLGALHVSITGKMWWWEVRYRDPASGREIVTANEIYIPVGRDVQFGLNSADVIHSFWVPQLAGKRDMIPGRLSSLTLRADRPGIYRGQCAEYCGAQHAHMAMHVVAVPQAEFDAWLARQALPAVPVTAPLLVRGRAAFLEQRCQACHTIRGVTEPAHRGPDLTHVGSRMHIAAGTLRTHQATLAGWVADPQSIKPGVFMPAAQDLDGESLRALAAYLEHLQ